MSEQQDATATYRLRSAVEDALKLRGIKTAMGPPVSHFEAADETGTQARVVYRSRVYGVAPDCQEVENRDNIQGRFREYASLEAAVLCDLAKIAGPFLLWRTTPEVFEEHGFLKAYMRLASLTSQSLFASGRGEFLDWSRDPSRAWSQ